MSRAPIGRRDGNLEGILWMLVCECLWNQTAIKNYRAEHDIQDAARPVDPLKQSAHLKKVAAALLELLDKSL
jgi:hypothetical protein